MGPVRHCFSLFAVLLIAAAGCQRATSTTAEPTDRQPPRVEGDDDVTIKTIPVAGTVYVLEGRGGNIGISAGDDGVLMIDSQFLPLAPKLKEAIAALGKGEPHFLINTHWHGDHTGGNPAFGVDAHIIAHDNVRARVAAQQSARGRTIEPLPPEGLPIVTYPDRLTLHYNGEEIRVVHLPTGHTDGDSVVYFTGSNVVHMGDHYFNGRFPFVDLASGGDVEQYRDNVAAVLEMIPASAKVIPGHGAVSDVAALRTYHAMLTETIDTVRGHMAKGKSLDQIKAAGLGAKWNGWGSGFIDEPAWITTIYESLSRSATR